MPDCPPSPTAAATRGVFITLEGGDGAGKTTLLGGLAAYLRQVGLDCIETREPGGGGPLAQHLRALLLDPAIAAGPVAQTLLHYAARADHLGQLIAPALAAGQWVLCDRFVDSSHAYQGAGLGVADELLEALDHCIVGGMMPDRTLLLDLDPALTSTRRAARGAGTDRYEAQPEGFAARARAGFLRRAMAEPERFRVLNAGLAPEEVLGMAIRAIADLLPGGGQHGP